MRRVHGYELAEELVLDLVFSGVEHVAIYEAAALGRMRVEVQVEGQPPTARVVVDDGLRGEYRGLGERVWGRVVAVKIVSQLVHTEVPSIDAYVHTQFTRVYIK